MSCLNNLPDEKLSLETEKQLARKIRKKDSSAVDTLVLHNLKEATIYAKHYCPPNLFSDGELMSLCYDVLLKSAPRFRTCYGLRFLAFTKNRLRGAVKRHMGTLDVVKHASERRTDFSLSAFVPFTGGTEPYDPNRATGDSGYLMDAESLVTCTQGGTTDFDFDNIHYKECWKKVQAGMETLLSPRQRMTIRLVYECGFNMQEIGRLLGISRSAVQATHASALEILRGAFAQNRELFLRP